MENAAGVTDEFSTEQVRENELAVGPAEFRSRVFAALDAAQQPCLVEPQGFARVCVPQWPPRERSLEIFGDEKALDRLVGSVLFGPSRLSLAQLRAYRSRPPLPTVRVGDGHVLLVVENSDTFDTMVRLLEGDPGDVGYVAWGAGAAFEASVASVGRVPGITRVLYFGDIDADGLRFPMSADALAVQLGLPPVEPATSLYRLLFEHGHRAAGGQPPVVDRSSGAALLLRYVDCFTKPRYGASRPFTSRYVPLPPLGFE